jgi:hypothetical protein
LAPPVGAVLEVRVNGEVLPPDAYRVDNGTHLVRTDHGVWPGEQSDLFTVTYLNGYPVDSVGQYVGGLLAVEFLNGMIASKKCRLPSSVTSLSRNGVSMEITQGMFPDMRTGINEIDAYLMQWNPNALRRAPGVYSPDLYRNRQITWRP